MKFGEIYLFFVPVEKNCFPEKYKKIAIYLPWKKKSTREKIQNSVHENFWLAVKM